jgi:hypothetical protein
MIRRAVGVMTRYSGAIARSIVARGWRALPRSPVTPPALNREVEPMRSKPLTSPVRYVVLVALCAAAHGARAQEGAAAPTSGNIEPKAIEILKTTCATMSAARTLSFTVVDTYEHAASNGQPLYYTVKSQVTLQRPNKLKILKIGDGVPDEFYYDGKTVMAYVPSQNVVAVADAPPTIDEMLSSAWEYAEIHFPFSDALVSDPCEILRDVKSAFYVGQSKVIGGVTTDIVALALKDVQGEFWIDAVDHLPRMIRTYYPDEPAHARYQTEYSDWQVNAPLDPSAFKSAKASAARRIAFQAPSTAGAPADATAEARPTPPGGTP